MCADAKDRTASLLCSIYIGLEDEIAAYGLFTYNLSGDKNAARNLSRSPDIRRGRGYKGNDSMYRYRFQCRQRRKDLRAISSLELTE